MSYTLFFSELLFLLVHRETHSTIICDRRILPIARHRWNDVKRYTANCNFQVGILQTREAKSFITPSQSLPDDERVPFIWHSRVGRLIAADRSTPTTTTVICKWRAAAAAGQTQIEATRLYGWSVSAGWVSKKIWFKKCENRVGQLFSWRFFSLPHENDLVDWWRSCSRYTPKCNTSAHELNSGKRTGDSQLNLIHRELYKLHKRAFIFLLGQKLFVYQYSREGRFFL